MSENNSRYKGLQADLVKDSNGRDVPALPPAPRGQETLRGYHKRRDRERIDQLAYVYLKDSCAFHRIADVNGAILPDALTEAVETAIPEKVR
ncbi:hypothetical protein [Hoeflea sp.]|uniref:hypothetical protein n=1 Tax=Hoeflea sp. TaxID=1940281 RepID=UPI003B02E2A2